MCQVHFRKTEKKSYSASDFGLSVKTILKLYEDTKKSQKVSSGYQCKMRYSLDAFMTSLPKVFLQQRPGPLQQLSTCFVAMQGQRNLAIKSQVQRGIFGAKRHKCTAVLHCSQLIPATNCNSTYFTG